MKTVLDFLTLISTTIGAVFLALVAIYCFRQFFMDIFGGYHDDNDDELEELEQENLKLKNKILELEIKALKRKNGTL